MHIMTKHGWRLIGGPMKAVPKDDYDFRSGLPMLIRNGKNEELMNRFDVITGKELPVIKRARQHRAVE